MTGKGKEEKDGRGKGYFRVILVIFLALMPAAMRMTFRLLICQIPASEQRLAADLIRLPEFKQNKTNEDDIGGWGCG